MRFSTMIRLFFILYCFEAGLLLLFAPWMPEWERIMMQLAPFQGFRTVLLYPWFRGAVTGFGMVHLVWGAHDLISIIFRRSPEAGAPSSDTQDVRAARDQ
ncbi:MAG TPA: hypothetical protein VKM72_24725 [Thermoanaerobaculia bacterium]|nr:hypothetical protein [Thermoanaerobaculia bacterium]